MRLSQHARCRNLPLLQGHAPHPIWETGELLRVKRRGQLCKARRADQARPLPCRFTHACCHGQLRTDRLASSQQAVLDNLLGVHREGVPWACSSCYAPATAVDHLSARVAKTAELFSAQVGGRLMGHFTAAFQRAVAQTTHDWFMQTEHDSWFNILSAAAGRRPAG